MKILELSVSKWEVRTWVLKFINILFEKLITARLLPTLKNDAFSDWASYIIEDMWIMWCAQRLILEWLWKVWEKFASTYFSKVWLHNDSDTFKIFRSAFFEEDNLTFFWYTLFKYTISALLCTVWLWDLLFKIVLQDQYLQNHTLM